MRVLIAFCLGVTTLISAQQTGPLSTARVSHGRPAQFENQFLSIQLLPGWNVAKSFDQALNLVHGKYLLSIDPVFTHASGVIGGRFSEFASGKPSIDAVMRDVDQPAGGGECSQWPPDRMVVSKAIVLINLYTDSSRPEIGCVFPSSGEPAWFGSYFSGEGSETDYAITLTYDTHDVNTLPKKGASDLKFVFGQVAEMLKTLQLKPPIVISRVDPESASPGATVTVYGSGFNLFHEAFAVQFSDFANSPMPPPAVAADGKSLTFEVPPSINTMSCEAGRIEVAEFCLPTPANHVNINDCPPSPYRQTNFCGIPTPPGRYQVWVTATSSTIRSNSVPFAVRAAKPGPVSIVLLYPNYLVSPGEMITVRGGGFTLIGNTVHIGSAAVKDITSPDGTTISFQAPAPAESSLMPGTHTYEAWVSNANGQSNPISFGYR